MVRISKQSEKRAQSPRRPKVSLGKPEKKRSHVSYKNHSNALEGAIAATAFIPKIK